MPLSVLPLCTRLLLWNTSLGSRNPNTGDCKLLYAPLWFVCGQILFKIARCSGALVVGVPLWLLCSSFCSKLRFNFALSPDSLLLSNQLPVIWEVESWLREITRLIACLSASLAIYFLRIPLYSSSRLMSRMVWKSKGNGRCSRTGKTKNWKTWLILRHCWKKAETDSNWPFSLLRMEHHAFHKILLYIILYSCPLRMEHHANLLWIPLASPYNTNQVSILFLPSDPHHQISI